MVRPRSPAPTVILSLGLGLSLLVMIALTDGSLRAQISGQLAEEAPSFILPNLDKERRDEIEALAAGDERIAGVETTPVLRASIAAVKDSPVAELPTLPEDIAGLFRGDISVTWSHAIPEGSTVIEGEWWPQDYAGEPLVSLGEDLREPLGLTLGDSIDLTVVGRPVRLVIASFREIDFNTSGMNFRFVLSPGLIEQAPARYTLALSAAPGQDEALEADLATRFPELTMIPVAQALDRAAGILGSLANAVGLIGGLAVVSGALVLAGAMSVGRRQRDADAVVMKILGATRAGVILAFVLEYALLGALSGLLALMLGSLGAFAVVRGVLELPFAFDLPLAAIIVGGAVILTVSTGVLTTWSSLSVQPARKIRDGLT